MFDQQDTNRFGGIEATPNVQKRMLSVCGGPVCVYEAGQNNGASILMLHGAMYDESRFIWDSLFPALSERYHVFALDCPRHGGSRPWDGVLDGAKLMEILAGAVQQLSLERFSIVGLSMGGGLAIEYASLHPEQMETMVLFEPGGLGEHVDLQLFTWLYIHTPGMLRMLSRRYVKCTDTEIKKLLLTIFTKGTKPANPNRLTAILKDEIHGKFSCCERDMDDWQISAIAPFRLKWNLLEQVRSINCPTLWLRGAKSKLVKQSEMERAVALARTQGAQAELKVIANAGHILPLEQPEQANTAVMTYLERVLG